MLDQSKRLTKEHLLNYYIDVMGFNLDELEDKTFGDLPRI